MSPLVRMGRAIRSICSLNRGREFKLCLSRLAPGPSTRLLDVGSGDGFWTCRFTKQFHKVIGLEPARYAATLARQLRSGNTHFVRGTAEALCFEDCSFDSIVSISCLEHFQDPQAALADWCRVLKTGGRLALSVDSLIPENSSAGFRNWHSRKYLVTSYFSEKQIIDMLRAAGFHPEPGQVAQLFTSKLACRLRETFLRRPKLWLPVFPVLYAVVCFLDRRKVEIPGQILILSATKPA